jgi:hypothetical protein
MSIETLNTAVHAAGFAMAAGDETAADTTADQPITTEAWRPGEDVMPDHDVAGSNASLTITDRLKGMLGLL